MSSTAAVVEQPVAVATIQMPQGTAAAVATQAGPVARVAAEQGPAGRPGADGTPGTDPDLPDLTLVFENGLV